MCVCASVCVCLQSLILSNMYAKHRVTFAPPMLAKAKLMRSPVLATGARLHVYYITCNFNRKTCHFKDLGSDESM